MCVCVCVRERERERERGEDRIQYRKERKKTMEINLMIEDHDRNLMSSRSHSKEEKL